MSNESTVFVSISPCRGMEIISRGEFHRRVRHWRRFLLSSEDHKPLVVDAVMKTASNLINPTWYTNKILNHMSLLEEDMFLHGEVRTECITEIEEVIGEKFFDRS
jgi:hypothetical protein